MFRRESEMLQPVLGWLESQNLLVKKEFPTPWGICDAVGVRLNSEKATKRLRYGQRESLGSVCAITLLDSIPDQNDGRSTTRRSLERAMGDFLTPCQVSDQLARLQRKRFISSPRLNHFQKLNGWMPLHERIVVVEMKLDRVEDVLFQACNNRVLGTESYAALPSPVAYRLMDSKRALRFSETGVGILAVHRDTVKVLLHSDLPQEKPHNAMQTFLVDRFWHEYQRQLSINC